MSERLTKKDETVLGGYSLVASALGSDVMAKSLSKLGQLEDIEEELGVDLITLFKALKYGVYFKGNKELKDVKLRMFYEEPMLVHTEDDSCEEEVYVEGYKTSWALTKEELE